MAVTLGRADAAADLSWIEGQLAAKERGDTHAEVHSPQSQPQGRGAERRRNVDGCESPFEEIPTGSALTMESRLVPESATLSVGAFSLVCRDDRVQNISNGGHDAAVHGLKSGASLGKLEISSDTSNGVHAWGLDNMEPTVVAATAAIAEARHTSLAVSWNALTATNGEQSPVPASTGPRVAKPELSRILKKFFSRRSVGSVPRNGARASLRLGEVRIQCRPLEAEAKRGAEPPPTSSSCIVVRNISAVPCIVVVQPRQPSGRNLPVKLADSERAQHPRSPSARGISAGVRGTSREPKLYESAGGSSIRSYASNGGPDDNTRPPPRQSPPPLPPRPPPLQPLPPMRLQRLHLPEVKFHATTVTGNVDAGLAGWLNLRGLREAELLSAKERRTAKLVAGGKQENNSVANAGVAGSPSVFMVSLSRCVAELSSKSTPFP